MAVDAVIFDWGGTLTSWMTVDLTQEWRAVAAVAAPDQVDYITDELCAAAEKVWARSRDGHRSGTLEEVCRLAGVDVTAQLVRVYRDNMEHVTHTRPEARPLLEGLRASGIKVGLLSNTLWPRSWHEEFLKRDGVFDLLDGAVFSSEIPWTKPHPEAFRAAMDAVGVDDAERCVYVGDRLFDDVYGANQVGMRAVFVPHSEIPRSQHGHSEGEPDAVIDRLSDLPEILGAW